MTTIIFNPNVSPVAVTASYALFTATSSIEVINYSSQSLSASYAETAAFALRALTSSYADSAGTTGGSVGGNGTANNISKWSSTATLTDSNLTDNGTRVLSAVPLTITGSVTASVGFRGNLTGTASVATTALTANTSTSSSHALNADVAKTATTASLALNSITASYSLNAGGAPEWSTITNRPVGLVSSSVQINTGSFSGSITTASYAQISLVSIGASSGLVSGGLLSINASNSASFDIQGGSGVIIEATSQSFTPVIHQVTWSNMTGITPTYLNTSTLTAVYIDKTGSVHQEPTLSTDEDFRDKIYLGRFGHTNKLYLTAVNVEPFVYHNPAAQLRDLYRALGPIREGLTIGPADADLSINRTAGTLTSLGINYSSDVQLPNLKSYGAVSPLTFSMRTTAGSGSSNLTQLDVTHYDLSGSVTLVGGVASTSQNMRVFMQPNGNIVIQYGQRTYSNLSDAIAAIPYEPFTVYENLQSAALLCIISVRRDTTDLSNATRAIFTNTGKLSSVSNASGTSVPALTNYSGSFTGSFRGDGSQLTGVVASGVGISISDDSVTQGNAEILNFLNNISATVSSGTASISVAFPTGLVSSSLQINTGSFSGSITSASNATTASYAETVSGYINFPNGLSVTGSLSATSGFTGSVQGNASTATTASFAVTASYAMNGGGSGVSSSFATTASYATLAATASYYSGNVTFPNGLDVTGSLVVTGGITGSLSGSITSAETASFAITASYALNGGGSGVSSSFATTASYANVAGTATTAATASYLTNNIAFSNGFLVVTGSIRATTGFTGSVSGNALTATTASFATTASYARNADTLDGLNSSVLVTTGSNTFVGNQTITGSLITDADTLIFTGSLYATGSWNISSSLNIFGGITGSMLGTSSFSLSSTSASISLTSTTSSYAMTASFIDGGFY